MNSRGSLWVPSAKVVSAFPEGPVSAYTARPPNGQAGSLSRPSITRSLTSSGKARYLGLNAELPDLQLLTTKSMLLNSVQAELARICRSNQGPWLLACDKCFVPRAPYRRSSRAGDAIPWISQRRAKESSAQQPGPCQRPGPHPSPSPAPRPAEMLPAHTHYSMTRVKLFLLSKAS